MLSEDSPFCASHTNPAKFTLLSHFCTFVKADICWQKRDITPGPSGVFWIFLVLRDSILYYPLEEMEGTSRIKDFSTSCGHTGHLYWPCGAHRCFPMISNEKYFTLVMFQSLREWQSIQDGIPMQMLHSVMALAKMLVVVATYFRQLGVPLWR